VAGAGQQREGRARDQRGVGAAVLRVDDSVTFAPEHADRDASLSGQVPDLLDVCPLMPLGEVQGQSPFATPLATASSTMPSAASGVCRYDVAVTSELKPSITLVVEGAASPAEAVAGLQPHRQDALDRNEPVAEIAGLGDAAITVGDFDEIGLYAASGNRILHALLKGEYPDVGTAAKVAAGKALLSLLISRLP
jgi:hypothetical protein